MVYDIQLNDTLLTDPVIHSVMDLGVSRGNAGIEGIRQWAQGHRCSNICEILGLPAQRPESVTVYEKEPPSDVGDDVSSESESGVEN